MICDSLPSYVLRFLPFWKKKKERENKKCTKTTTFSRFFLTRQGFDCHWLLLHMWPAWSVSTRALSGEEPQSPRQTGRTSMACSKTCSKASVPSLHSFSRTFLSSHTPYVSEHFSTTEFTLPSLHWTSLPRDIRGGCAPRLELPGHHTPAPARDPLRAVSSCHQALNTATHHGRRWVLFLVARWMKSLILKAWC